MLTSKNSQIDVKHFDKESHSAEKPKAMTFRARNEVEMREKPKFLQKSRSVDHVKSKRRTF